MANVIFSKSTASMSDGTLARIGKIATPLKMIMKKESDLLAKADGPVTWLFNVEKSNAFAETIVTENSMGLLGITDDGGVKPFMGNKEINKVTVEHFEISGQWAAIAAMLEDSIQLGNINAQLKRQAKDFIESYYTTRHYIATAALTSGLSTTFLYDGRQKSIACADGLALFNKGHVVGADGDTQSNCFYNVRADGVSPTNTMVESILGTCAVKMRNFTDENGRPLGYTGDTIIIPGNTPAWENRIKSTLMSVSGSNSAGALSGSANVQIGNWHLIILPTWKVSNEATCPMIIMSSEANKKLSGNMFYDRTPFIVKDWEDYPTSNYCMSGRARIGLGFGTYKHALYFESIAYGGTTMVDGSTASTVGTAITL